MLPVIIPFVLLLAILPLPLVPYHEPAAEDHSAVIKTGLPTDPSNGPMYAELAEGMTISNNVKVFFKDYTTRYYYCVEDNNGILSVTTDLEEATIFQILPATDSKLSYEGQFYLGYNSSMRVVVSFHSLNHMELTLDSPDQDLEEWSFVVPIVGLISPFYHHYFNLDD